MPAEGKISGASLCPQCRIPTETAVAPDGREYRRCGRCGWSDLDVAAPGSFAAPAAQSAVDANARRRRNIILLVIVVDVIATLILAVVLIILRVLGKGV
jgi:hypothetical protein